MIFSKQEKQLIEAAVKSAEAGSRGEIVPLVVASSGDYSSLGYRLGFVGFLVASTLAWWIHFRWAFVELHFLLGVQIAGFLIGKLFGRLPSVIRLFAGAKRLTAEVHEAALASFTRHGLHHTRQGTGILIFVSLLEHRVEIVADKGIHAKVGQDFWQLEAQKLVLGIRENRAAETLALVIQEMGSCLREYFPGDATDLNELSDELR